MARNKSGKRTLKSKTTSRAQIKNTKKTNKSKKGLNTKQQIQAFIQTPAAIAKQVSKEIAGLQKQAAKLTKALNKSDSQINQTTKKMQKAEKLKTAAGKKQLRAAQKQHLQLSKAQSSLINQFEINDAALQSAQDTHSKLATITKFLNQFAKEGNKPNKATKATTAKKKTTSKTKKSTAQKETAKSPNYNQYQTQADSHLDETAEMEETAESTS